MTVSWQAHGLSDVGKMRRGNEDAFRMDDEAGIFVVADGMGGHAAGEVASRLAADATLETLRTSRLSSEADIQHALSESFREAHRRIVECCADQPETAGMGTTLTAAVLTPTGSVYLGHIGDSRAYQLSSETLRQLTHDHTWVQQEVDAGRVNPDAARSHPLSHVLTRVLTAGDPSDPDLRTGAVRSRDLLLLCSDGLYNMVEPQRLLDLLRSDEPTPQIAARLIKEANDRGGADNITVIVIRID